MWRYEDGQNKEWENQRDAKVGDGCVALRWTEQGMRESEGRESGRWMCGVTKMDRTRNERIRGTRKWEMDVWRYEDGQNKE